MCEQDWCIIQKNERASLISVFKKIPFISASLDNRIDINEYLEKLSLYAENYILYENGKEKVFVSVYMNDYIQKTAYITMISCFPNEEKKGYGKRLFTFIKKLAELRGFKTLKLEVNAKNQNAILFYEKMGMKKVAKTDFGYYMDMSTISLNRGGNTII